ncbi:MAG: hypothetical protein HOP02_09245 [Methylococcaceae bacterium]|nr:hypothetical protein [Methylococcaceae bacterium]
MDKITKQLLTDFLKDQEITSTTEAEDFEKFCNYTVLSNEYNKTFDVNTVTVGAGSDTEIDGIAIIVNGYLVDGLDTLDRRQGNFGLFCACKNLPFNLTHY